MIGLPKLIFVELKLLARSPSWLFTIGIPLFSLLVFGLPLRSTDPTADLSGLTATSVTTSLALVGLYTVPVTLATYRDKGILRRFSTTPLSPLTLLMVQLVLHLGLILISTIFLLGVARIGLGVALPQQLLGFACAFFFGAFALFAIGLVIASVAPNAATANGIGVLVFFPMAFLAGLMLPKELMPESLARIGEFTPLGAFRQAIQATWVGSPLDPLQVLVMVLFAVIAALAAVRLFRWQ